MQKKHIATKYILPINTELRKSFLEYLRNEHSVRASAIYLEYLFNLISNAPLINRLFSSKRLSSSKGKKIFIDNEVDLYFLMCHWATTKLSENTAVILKSDHDF
jgi:hypothetical protein